jgi:Ala-tRNA(Pro) deacylase
MSAERVRTYLMEHGVQYETHSHPTAYTTAETAAAEHVPGEQMAKVVLLKADDRLVMAVVPGNRMVDLGKAKAALNAGDVDLADEKDFAPVFADCEAGAEPPFGMLYEVPMIVDDGMTTDRITFAAGSHDETITMALDDYLRVTNPKRADLTLGT